MVPPLLTTPVTVRLMLVVLREVVLMSELLVVMVEGSRRHRGAHHGSRERSLWLSRRVTYSRGSRHGDFRAWFVHQGHFKFRLQE